MYSEGTVRRFYHLLGHVKQTEIRMLRPGQRPRSEFVDSEDGFESVCARYNGEYDIYAGINERALRKRSARDVLTLNNVVFDIDVEKPDGCGATCQELHAAVVAASEGCLWIVENGIHQRPVRMSSGNGCYIWLCLARFPLRTARHRETVKNTLRKFSEQMASVIDRDGVAVDRSVTSDPARIMRVPGTRNLKGLDCEDPARNAGRYAMEIDPLERHEDRGFSNYLDQLARDGTRPRRQRLNAAQRKLQECRKRMRQLAGLEV